ncbi:MAG: hypothetical protein WBA51_14890 [Erythrobacter sp.]
MIIVSHFDTALALTRAYQTGKVSAGSVFVINDECIVGLTGLPASAVTEQTGPFRPIIGSSRNAILASSPHTASQITAAVDEAYRHGFPVCEQFSDFATMRSEMSACASEFRLTSDEILAILEACETRTADIQRTLGEDTGPVDSKQILRLTNALLRSARAKLLDRTL